MNKSAHELNHFTDEQMCSLNIPSSVIFAMRIIVICVSSCRCSAWLAWRSEWPSFRVGEGKKTRIATGGGNSRRGRERKKEWNNPVVRAPRESVRGEGEGVGYPACRQNGTGEGAAAFLLAVQEPERPRNILRERHQSGAPIHRLLSWARGGSLPRPHPEVLQLQWNPPGLWPWPFTDVVWRKSQRDGPQGECRVQPTRWENMWHFRLCSRLTHTASSSH